MEGQKEILSKREIKREREERVERDVERGGWWRKRKRGERERERGGGERESKHTGVCTGNHGTGNPKTKSFQPQRDVCTGSPGTGDPTR